MKIKLLALSVTAITFLSHAQNPQLQWAKSIGSATNDIGYSVTHDLSGNIYTTGFFDGTADFDPGPGVYT